MNPAEFSQLDEAEKKHFYRCELCGEMVDMRQLDDVLFHEDHVQRPDIQYGGSEEIGKKSQRHSYEVRPRGGNSGVDLISDALPSGRLWFGGEKPVSDAILYAVSHNRAHDRVVRVYDSIGHLISTLWRKGEPEQR
jgi:hypothetical protein